MPWVLDQEVRFIMTRRTLIAALAVGILAQLSGCCWHRPLFNRGCYPHCNSFGAAAPAIAPGPVLGGGYAAPTANPSFSGVPAPDCVGCGGGAIPFSAAPSLKSGPYGDYLAAGMIPHGAAPTYAAYPTAFKPEQMGLPTYPAGQPMPASAIPPGSTPLPQPMVTKEEPKKN